MNATISTHWAVKAAGLTLVALLASGCASTRSEDPAKAREAAISDISGQWKKGSDLVTAGEKTRSKGAELVAEGQRQMSEGDSQIARGRTLMAESETAFRDASRKGSLR